MTLAQALSTYLTLNLLLLIGSGGLGLLAVICNARLGAGVQLRLHYAVIVLLLAFTCLHPLFPSNEVFSPAAKVWSAPSIQTFGDDYAPAKNRGYLSLPTPIGTSTLSSDHVALAA